MNHKDATQGLRREASAVVRYTKPLGWGTTLSKTHDMPKKARTAREQSSPGPTPSVNAPVAGGMALAAQLHAVMQQHEWAATVQTPGGAAGQFAAHQVLLVAPLLVVESLLLLLLLLEAVPMKPPPLDPLSTKGTRTWQRCVRSARKRDGRVVLDGGWMTSYFKSSRTILTDYQPVVSRWVVVWHIASKNYLPSSLRTRSLLISCAS